MSRFWLVLLVCAGVRAHDLAYSVYAEPAVAAVRWTYAGEDPVKFAAITVIAPSGKTYQTGRTDENGSFAFVPNASGKWRVAVDDDEGHKAEAVIEVADGKAVATGGSQPLWQKWLTGIAVIAGATGLLLAWKTRRSA